mmetsp:Transcript_22252/g.68578  ORF Transcript_22252/g.68578 Transcript_22252/m.68578 type:complete len:107 (+) Transcript_22252:376-696(+)
MSSGTLKEKLSALFLMAAALGFGAIWSMHFVGMMAMEAFHPDGTRVAIRYHIGKHFVKLPAALLPVADNSRAPPFPPSENDALRDLLLRVRVRGALDFVLRPLLHL